jgi:hypothetical protein
MDVPQIVGDLNDADVIDQDVATMAAESVPETRDAGSAIPVGDDRSNVPTAVAVSNVATSPTVTLPVVMLPLLVLLTTLVWLKKRTG